jgi:hypothetical protein
MHYAWFIWSLLFLALWIVIYFSLKNKEIKNAMLMVSLWTLLTGLTEPFFVPAYWYPPSLFDLAWRTGFDIESFIFAFAVAGTAFVAYNRIFNVLENKVSIYEKHSFHHRYHFFALMFTPVVFLTLFFVTSLNPIYSAIIAMLGGGLATWYCRPDLKKKMFTSAFIFLSIYFIYFLTLIAMYPGYVESVWKLSAISGILIVGIPLEELLFAVSFGFMWSSVYEHIAWKKIKHNL